MKTTRAMQLLLAAATLCACAPIRDGDTVKITTQWGTTEGQLWGGTSEPVVLKRKDGSVHYFYGSFQMSKIPPAESAPQ
jgi:hypothetical protein